MKATIDLRRGQKITIGNIVLTVRQIAHRLVYATVLDTPSGYHTTTWTRIGNYIHSGNKHVNLDVISISADMTTVVLNVEVPDGVEIVIGAAETKTPEAGRSPESATRIS